VNQQIQQQQQLGRSPILDEKDREREREREKEREREREKEKGVGEVEYLRVIEEALRMKGLNGNTGEGEKVKIPRTEREGVRRLILAICGEGLKR
jgi:hypothetical protein